MSTFLFLFLAICVAASKFRIYAFQPAAVVETVGGCGIRHYQTCPIPQRRPPRHFARGFDVDDKSSTSSSIYSSQFLLSDDQTDFQTLMIMDVVLFLRRDATSQPPQALNDSSSGGSSRILELGAVQENGNVAPLSTWTLDSAYTSATNDMLEFVVDDSDAFPGLTSNDIRVLAVLDGSVMSYGSRQVGGGKGPGNPHGEESELIYYIERDVVEKKYIGILSPHEVIELSVNVIVNPKLEHLW